MPLHLLSTVKVMVGAVQVQRWMAVLVVLLLLRLAWLLKIRLVGAAVGEAVEAAVGEKRETLPQSWFVVVVLVVVVVVAQRTQMKWLR